MSKQVNRKEFIERIVEASSLTKRDADIFLDAFVDVVGDALVNNEKVSLMGFGLFEVRERSQRNGVNPKTGEPIVIKACKTPGFKASVTLKKKVNGE